MARRKKRRDALTIERQHSMATGGGGPCPEIAPQIPEPALFVEVRDGINPNCNDLVSQTDPNLVVMPPQAPNANHPNNTQTILNAIQHTSSDAVGTTTAPTEIEHETQNNNTTLEMDIATNENELRVKILKEKHINREKRANEQHSIVVKYKKQKYKLQIAILKKQLQEACAKSRRHMTISAN